MTLKVSEIFQSLQGEGVTTGELASFLRLATCNLCCSWCDTKYTWDFNNHRYEDEVRVRDVESVAAELERALPRRLIVTGGEPLLQQRPLGALCELLGDMFVIEVETNGTLEPSDVLATRVDQWNVSPKLSNSGNREARRLRLDALASFRETGNAWLKIVVSSEADVGEAESLVRELAWPRERVLLMPEATTSAGLRKHTPFVERASAQAGFRFSGRLHLELWDGRRGT